MIASHWEADTQALKLEKSNRKLVYTMYQYYKTFIEMATFDNDNGINELLEEIANCDELTNSEYTDLYQLAMDKYNRLFN